MNRRDRRRTWSLDKVSFRGVGPRTHWRDMWRQSWSSYKVGGETAGRIRKGSVLRLYDRAEERRRHDAAVRRAREAVAG